jgi:hypothetical protein
MGNPDYPPLQCFLQYGVCPAGAITPLSQELWRLYNACDGTRRCQNPADFYELPAIYVDACQVIDADLERIRKIRAKDANTK